MPGLVESHAHIGLADMSSHDLTRLPVEEHMLIAVRNARPLADIEILQDRSALRLIMKGGALHKGPRHA